MTSASLFDREQELFNRCLDAPESSWEQVLETHCDDPDLRERVRRLLRHHRETPTHDPGFLNLEGGDPDRIGPYRILRRLGEGGMGLVFAAEQREPVRRKVAVKVLRSGYSSREVLARFDIERQALSLMSHANIARILDAGTTADHRPFIVMEFVPGEPITTYSEQHRLPLRQRLELFIDVCDAVQHAHQRGVIHRDLKPSNILVMEEDGRPVPKVIDFGIAKAITQRLTDHTLETKVGSLLGTPDYMSPEQAELSPLDVDTRADVYALGAVLYQLLAGVPPLQLSNSGKSYSDMQRVIREVEPPPVSRLTDGMLKGRIRGELDWILAKALEKDRNRRYATVTGLKEDLARHLRGDIPIAGPKTLRYRAAKFLRRHYIGTTVVTGAFIMITTFAALLLAQVHETAFERDRANLAAENARRQAEVAEHVIEFTSGLFELASPVGGGSSDISARELLDAGVRRMQGEAIEDPTVRASLLEAAGNAYAGLGVYDKAEPLLETAVALRLPEADHEPLLLSQAMISLSDLKTEQSELDAAEAIARRALDVYDHLPARLQVAAVLRLKSKLSEAAALLEPLDRFAADSDFHEAALALGRIRIDQGRFDEGEALVRKALVQARLAHGDSSAQAIEAMLAHGEALFFKGNAQGAVDVFRRALNAARPLYGEQHRVIGVLLNNLGATLYQLNKLEEAESAYLQALAVNSAVLGQHHFETANVHNNLGNIYLLTEQWEKAQDSLRTALELRTQLLGSDHPETLTSQLSLAIATAHLGNKREGARLARDVIAGMTARLGARHWRTGNAHFHLGRILGFMGNRKEAISQVRLAAGILEEALGTEHVRSVRAREWLARNDAPSETTRDGR